MRSEDAKLLAGIVTAVEVLWWPVRFDFNTRSSDEFCAVMQRRAKYRSGAGLDWTVGGGVGDRQAGNRSLKRLAADGLIELHAGNQQRRGVSLLDIDACLSVTANRVTHEAWPVLELIAQLTSDPAVLRNGKDFICERAAAGIPDESTDGKLASDLAFNALPLLIRGWLETISDAEGRIGWRITDDGRQALLDGPPEANMLPYDSEIALAQMDESNAALRERSRWKPENPNDIVIPLSAGTWYTPNLMKLADDPDERRRRQLRRTGEGKTNATR